MACFWVTCRFPQVDSSAAVTVAMVASAVLQSN